MKRSGGIILVLGVIAVALSAPPTLGASPPVASGVPGLLPGEPWIAFQRETAGRYGVHVVRTDGTDIRFPFGDLPGGIQLHPDWSPDGERMVLDVEAPDGTQDVWIADVSDWSAEVLVDCVSPCLWVNEPAWSPDGGSIAYQRHVDDGTGETSQVEILDLDTGTARVVYRTGTDRGVFAPRWSPDGGSLVFEQLALSDGEFLGVSLEVLALTEPGATTRTIVPVDRYANNSDWSPNGELITFSAPAEGGEPGGARSDIWVAHPDGSGMTRLTDAASNGGMAVQPTFTPDGDAIVFLLTDRARGFDEAMAIIAIDGTGLAPATTSGPMYGWHPRVRPMP